MADFIHLHNHSDFSLQDGAQTVQMLCDRVGDLGMDSIALTEHGNLFSMIPLFRKRRARGIAAGEFVIPATGVERVSLERFDPGDAG